jgi:dTDP-4-dehydrorhamnose 3,5-epimerase
MNQHKRLLAIMSNRFNIIDAPISGLKIIRRLPIGDSRGYLERLFCIEELEELLKGKSIHQINHTLTSKSGTVRGLHFQLHPYSEIKMVSCLKGEVYDVAIDLRLESPSYLKYHSEILSESDHKTFFIPQGFAHGFQTLTDNCEMLYFHTAPYVAKSERGINAFDPQIGIQWPNLVTEISDRDKNHPLIIK